MKKIIHLMVCLVMSASLILLSACAGKTPDPVAEYQQHDEQMACTDINAEIEQNQMRITQLLPKTQKTGKNVALAATGAFFVVPLFFMDFSDAEQREINAFQRRDARLHRLATARQCNDTLPSMKIDQQQKQTA